jgi:hypothetical protein
MKILSPKRQFLQTAVRNIVAANPLVPIRRVQELVRQRTDRSISKNFASRLMDEVRDQAINESNQKEVNERVSELRERHRILIEYLTRVQNWQPDYVWEYGMRNEPTLRERMAAIKLISQLELTLFKAESITGLFERKGATLQITRSQSTTLKVDLKN